MSEGHGSSMMAAMPADFTVVNAYSSTPEMGSNRALPHVADAMKVAAESVFDVSKFRSQLESQVCRRLGFTAALAVAGARSGLAAAADLSLQRRPGTRIALVNPSPRTKYSHFLAVNGQLTLMEFDLTDVAQISCRDDVALCLITLSSAGNDLEWIAKVRDRLTELSIPLVLNAALAPWCELAILADPNAIVVTSASKYHAGPASAGFVLLGEKWKDIALSWGSEARQELLRPGKEALAGLQALASNFASVPCRADDENSIERHDQSLIELGFTHADRASFWSGDTAVSGYRYTRCFASREGGASTADKVATRLWNFSPPIIIGCAGDLISVDMARLSVLEADYLVAAVFKTINWALRERI